MERERQSIQLIVFGADLDPTLVAKKLALPRGSDFSRHWTDERDGSYILGSHSHLAADADLRAHVTWLLDMLEPSAPVLREHVARGWTARIVLLTATKRRGGGGAIMPPDLLLRLAHIGIPVEWRTLIEPTL